MLWLQFPLSRSYIVTLVMLVKCGMQMTPLQREKLTDYRNGGVNWFHKVLSLAIFPMPLKLGWSQNKSITPLLQPFLPAQVSK